MKFLVVLFFLVASAYAHNVHRRGVEEQSAVVRSRNDDVGSPDGNFQYNFETSNGIVAQAQGIPKALPGSNPPEIIEGIAGSFSWTAPEGKSVSVQYTADENGYHPKVQL